MMRIKIVSMADCWEHLGLGGLRGLLLIYLSDWLHGDLFLNNHLCVCVCVEFDLWKIYMSPCYFVHDLCLCGQLFDGALLCYASLTSLCTCLYKCRNSRKWCFLEIYMYPCHFCSCVSMTCVCGQPFDANDGAIGQVFLFDCVATRVHLFSSLCPFVNFRISR